LVIPLKSIITAAAIFRKAHFNDIGPPGPGRFGSATFFVGDEIFFGKDRLRDVEELIQTQR
jgi:2-hydroxychromene-2-carboxylate isomerase